jgi:hypothetical protein
MTRLPDDPVIDEIREVRHRISARFEHDPEKLVAYYIKLQEQYGNRLTDSARIPEEAGADAAQVRGRD